MIFAVMIFAASWAISARLYRLFQRFAPSNIVIRWVRTRDGIKWGPLVALAGVIVYGLLLVASGTVVDHLGASWVNLVVLVAFWDAIKFAWLIPVSLVRRTRARHQEKALSHAGPHPREAKPTTACGATVDGAVVAGHVR